MKELTFNPQIDVQQCVLWQYANSPALRTLLQAKSDFYEQNVTQFWNDWFNDVFNINTATDFGLTVWGEILDFPRQIKSNPGQIHFLTTEQYRTVLKGQFLKFRMSGTVPQVNEWLNVVFGSQGKVYCLDNLDMTVIPFVFQTNPSDEILWLLSNVDFLPRPAGVGYEVRVVGGDVFGFNGSGLQPFNQGTFYKNWNQDLDIEQGQYQLSINAPAGATVTINGLTGSYQSMVEGTQYTWSVSGNGFVSVSGSGTLTQDTTINVYSFSISTNTPNSTILINGENCSGIYFLNSFTYTYQVSAIGYAPQSGSGTATKTTLITANLAAYSFSSSINNIITDGSGAPVLKTITAPYEGYYSITLAAESGLGMGDYNLLGRDVNNGGICILKTYLQPGDSIVLGKINGGGDSYGNSHGGAGVYCEINNVLEAVAGGGAESSGCGGGYLGGAAWYAYKGSIFYQWVAYNYDGTLPSFSEANREGFKDAFGGPSYTTTPGNEHYGYGGTSFAKEGSNITQIYGDRYTNKTGNTGPGYISVVYTGQN